MSQAQETYRVVGGVNGRERVMKTGQTREDAEAIRMNAMFSPLTAGIPIWIENEQKVERAGYPAPAPVAKTEPAPVFDQDIRTARALRFVLPDYTFCEHDEKWICESPDGKAYLVSDESCTCRDWQHRASKVGGRCKHQIAVGTMLFAQQQ